uniref:RNA-directed DNA polymerase n=1 Tax=Fagus sylvatica TaxID=28930 RepID=A0A2N9EMM8_FAGSY
MVSKHNLSLQMPQSDSISICGWHQKWRIGVSPVVDIEVEGGFLQLCKSFWGNRSGVGQSKLRAMVIKTRAGVPIGVLDENLQRLQTEIDEYLGAIEQLHTKMDRLEAKVDSGIDNLQAMTKELLMQKQLVVEQPEMQPRQEEEAHRVPLGAEMRNAMPMRPPNQDFKVQANQPRVGMQMGEGFENGQNGPILGEFGDPIEERRIIWNNARFMPPFQGHFDAPYVEPWLRRRQGRQLAVKMQGPRNLGEAYAYAYALTKIQEEYLATVKRSTRPTYKPSRGSWVQSQAQQGTARVENKSGDSKQFSARPSMPVQRCKNRKLYLMEEVEDEEVEIVEIEEEEDEAELEEEKAEITFTHNFMDETLAKTLKLPTDVESNFGVRVANGQVIRTLGECKEVKFKMQGLHLKLTFNLLKLGRCGIVLGTQWLSTLRVISWDFKNLVMGFMHEGKQVWLQGLKEKPNLIQGNKDFKGKATMKGLLLQIMPWLPPKRNHEHQILLKQGVPPHCQRLYRYPHYQKTKIEKIVKDLLDSGCVRPSQSPFASPALLVRKADGSWRMCVDYRGLNKETVKDKFPILVVDELLDELLGAVVFSKLDLRLGYHQIRMREEDIEKTVFKTHEGHYEYLVMPFGLTNAPFTFQALMNEVEYLRHIISGEGMKTDPKKIAAMVDWPIPKSLKALRGFLGLTGYYKKFIKEAEKAFEEAQGGRPLAYYSQALKGKNLFLSTYEKELLTLVLLIKKWRPYLFATIFTIKIDQQSLKYILEQRVGTPMQQKWISKLLGYHFVVEYKQSKENKVVDALSRKEDIDLKTEVERETTQLQAQIRGHLCVVSFPSPTWLDDLKPSYEEDEVLRSIVGRLQASGGSEGHYTLNQDHSTPLVWTLLKELPTSSKQNVILVIVDKFTNLHGLPSSIVSDRDTAFTSLFWEKLFRRQGVDLAMSSSYHPQSDGQTEVVNKSLEHYLRAFAADKPSLWVEWLPLAEYWFNTNYHTSTKLSPFEALYGYLPPRLIKFVPGLTRVAAKSMHKKLGKLGPKFYGPYKVIQRVGMVAYKLELLERACIHPVFHVSFLKAKLGKTITPILRLPPIDALGHLAPQPTKILETRTIKKRRLPAVTEVHVQWEGGD